MNHDVHHTSADNQEQVAISAERAELDAYAADWDRAAEAMRLLVSN